jgi:hypothetical protein
MMQQEVRSNCLSVRAQGVSNGLAIVAAVLALLALCTYLALGSVSSALAVANCPNEAFRTGPSAALPDCRAYELVSPPDKNGGSVDGGTIVETLNAPTATAPNGETVTYTAGTTFTEADPHSGLTNTQYFSRRGPDGWTTQAITPTQVYPLGRIDADSDNVDESPYQGFSEDLTRGFLVANEPQPVAGAPAGYYNPYSFDTTTDSYELLSTAVPPVQPAGIADGPKGGFIAIFAGYSADDNHVIFQANDALTPNAIPGEWNLYEYSEGRLELVSILPNGQSAKKEGSRSVEPSFGSAFREDRQGEYYNFDHAISANGKRVFWSDDGQIYMREDGVPTVDVSESQRTEPDPEGPEPATYVTSNAEGSLVYFTSCEKLTNNSTAEAVPVNGSGGKCYGGFIQEPLGEDLYQYNVNTGVLTDLTVSHNEFEYSEGGDIRHVHSASVVGWLGSSEDGSYVYFAARGVLAQGAVTGPSLDGEGDGNYNVYLWHDGEISFVATLAEGEEADEKDFVEAITERTSRVSPNGLLAFQSTRSLTRYDNRPLHPTECRDNAGNGYYPTKDGFCSEVYEYIPSTKTLECASCNPTGAPPTGDAGTPAATHVFEANTGWQDSVTQQRYLLEDGRLFFQSEDALLPQASDGRQNIYEREPDGVGGCQSAGGCLYLISSGTSNANSYFIDASTNGNDVFIEAQDQLVPADGDEERDVYDARVGGGFPYPSLQSCSGEACKPPVTPAAAIYQAPPSATFFGAGNLAPQPPKPATSTKAKKTAKKHSGKRKSKRRSKRSKTGKRSTTGRK